VILLRDTPRGLEAFLLERPEKAEVMGGVWVFPGGKVDAEDHKPQTDEDTAQLTQRAQSLHQRLVYAPVDTPEAAAFMRAARRETEEECSVRVAIDAIEAWSRWVTPRVPSMMNRRFDAFFFVASLPEGQQAQHDGEESVQGVWCAPVLALERYWRREIMLAPPQIMTLVELSGFAGAREAAAHASARSLPHIQPEPLLDPAGSRVVAYPGDEAHPVQARQIPGPSRLVWRNGRFEPPGGRFEEFLA
jgi:8-oxo-dGTP pyrophosphatase MutT (NUDIX family)